MTLTKKSDRVLKTAAFIKAIRSVGGDVKNLGEFRRWKELSDGSRLSVSLTLYRVSANGKTGYFFSDSLGRVACPLCPDLAEMKNFLHDKGYKTDRDFYIEDYGMTPEDYAAWNAESRYDN